jgi:hypothetical protein
MYLVMLNRADVLLLLCGAATRLFVGEAGVQVFALLLCLRLFVLNGGFQMRASVTAL